MKTLQIEELEKILTDSHSFKKKRRLTEKFIEKFYGIEIERQLRLKKNQKLKCIDAIFSDFMLRLEPAQYFSERIEYLADLDWNVKKEAILEEDPKIFADNPYRLDGESRMLAKQIVNQCHKVLYLFGEKLDPYVKKKYHVEATHSVQTVHDWIEKPATVHWVAQELIEDLHDVDNEEATYEMALCQLHRKIPFEKDFNGWKEVKSTDPVMDVNCLDCIDFFLMLSR